MNPVAMLQIVRFALLTSVVLYALIGEVAGPKTPATVSPLLFYILTLVAVTSVAVAFVLRRTLMKESEPTASGTVDASVINRWRMANIVTYALAESIAMFGLVLRMLGFTLGQILPFYLAGFILILFLAPRLPSNQVA
jgi:hypothetical protein